MLNLKMCSPAVCVVQEQIRLSQSCKFLHMSEDPERGWLIFKSVRQPFRQSSGSGFGCQFTQLYVEGQCIRQFFKEIFWYCSSELSMASKTTYVTSNTMPNFFNSTTVYLISESLMASKLSLMASKISPMASKLSLVAFKISL
jgi:hypothetical protein